MSLGLEDQTDLNLYFLMLLAGPINVDKLFSFSDLRFPSL